MLDEILFEEIPGKQGDIGLITLNRPDTLNALNLTMYQKMAEHFSHWENSPHIKAVIIRGKGERAFCAGGNIKDFYLSGKENLSLSQKFFWDEYRMDHRIFHFPKPYIALMHGITMGGGVGISLNGSYRVAAENLIFAMPETGIGLHPDVGVCYFLARCADQLGFYLGLSGHSITIGDALHIGAVQACVPYEKFPSLIDALALTEFSANPHQDVNRVTQSFSTPSQPSLLIEHKEIIAKCFSKNSMEEIITALQKENTDWSQQVIKILSSRSPSSLKVTLRQLQESAHLSFDDCLRLDYRLSMHFLEHPDFYEGIRAALIDKDRDPHWQPAKLVDVTSDMVESYFMPLTSSELTFTN